MEILKHIPNKIIENGKIKIPEWCEKIRIDVGLSHNAPNSQNWLESIDNLLVIGIEPNKSSIKVILGESNPPYVSKYVMDKKYINEKFFIVPIALSDYNGKTIFYDVKNILNENLEGYDMGSSSMNKPTYFEYNETIVDVFRLDEMFKLFDWSVIDFIEHLKIDAQGEDFKIIKGIGEYLDRIAFITFETTTYNQYHNTINEFSDISKLLTDHGFYQYTPLGADTTFFNKKYQHKNVQYIML